MILEDISELYPGYHRLQRNPTWTPSSTYAWVRIQRLFDAGSRGSWSSYRINRITSDAPGRRRGPEDRLGSVEKASMWQDTEASLHPDVSSVDPRRNITARWSRLAAATHILEHEKDLLFIDSGFSVYAEEMLALLNGMFPGFKQEEIDDSDTCGRRPLASVRRWDADISRTRRAPAAWRQSRMVDEQGGEQTCRATAI